METVQQHAKQVSLCLLWTPKLLMTLHLLQLRMQAIFTLTFTHLTLAAVKSVVS